MSCILVDRQGRNSAEGRLVINRIDSDGKDLDCLAVVRCFGEISIQAGIGHRNGNRYGAESIWIRREPQAARAGRRFIADGRVGNQGGITADGRHGERLVLTAASRNPNQVKCLLGRILVDRDVVDRRNSGDVVDRIHSDHECHRSRSIVPCIIQVTVRTRVFDNNCDRGGTRLVWFWREGNRTAGSCRCIGNRWVRYQAGVVAAGRHLQDLALSTASRDT